MTIAEMVGLPAEIITELDQLAGEDGQLVASDVVEAARPRGSVLHPFFTWENRQAAEAHRLNEARTLIRRYRVRITSDPEEGTARDIIIRGWTAARRVNQDAVPGTYLRTMDLDPPQREALVRTMAREIAAMRRRYGQYAEFWAALNSLLDDGPAAASGGGA